MQRGAEAGLPTALDAIGEGVLRAARAHRIETPTVARLATELTAGAEA